MKELTLEKRRELAELIGSTDIESIKLGIELLKSSEDYTSLKYKIVYYKFINVFGRKSYPVLLKDLLLDIALATSLTYYTPVIFNNRYILKNWLLDKNIWDD